MHSLSYPLFLKNGVRIVGETEFGEHLIKYQNADGSNSLIWLADELINPCSLGSMGHPAVEIVKNYFRTALSQGSLEVNHAFAKYMDGRVEC